MREASGSDTPALNGTEYLERLFATGIQESARTPSATSSESRVARWSFPYHSTPGPKALCPSPHGDRRSLVVPMRTGRPAGSDLLPPVP